MGIRFLDSILTLVAAAAGVLTAYMVGHALSAHETWAWLAAAGSLAVAVMLGFVVNRRVRSYARGKGEDLNL